MDLTLKMVKNMDKLKEYILDKIFIISSQPVLFEDLLKANALFNEGMMIDPAKLNFKFNLARLYLIYGIICLIFIFVGIVILHGLLVKIDSHFSIIGTAIITSCVFIGFDIFKRWARKEISLRLIKKAWSIHLAYFDYEKYKKQVEQIYNEAHKDEVLRKDLEKYVLEKLVNMPKA